MPSAYTQNIERIRLEHGFPTFVSQTHQKLAGTLRLFFEKRGDNRQGLARAKGGKRCSRYIIVIIFSRYFLVHFSEIHSDFFLMGFEKYSKITYRYCFCDTFGNFYEDISKKSSTNSFMDFFNKSELMWKFLSRNCFRNS